MTLPKKLIVRDMTVTEVSTVDRPAQKGAVAVLLKSAGVDISKNASEIAAGLAGPQFKAAEYGDAMMARAEEIAAEKGTTAAKALLDHCNSDPVLIALAHGERAAELAARAALAETRFEKLDRWPGLPQRGHLLPEAKSERRNCLLCTKTFETKMADRKLCERCQP